MLTAKQLEIPGLASMNKDELVAAILNVDKKAGESSGEAYSVVIPEEEFTGDLLPEKYGRDKVVLLTRDPRWLYAYWEISGDRDKKIREEASGDIESNQLVLRIHEIENGESVSWFDIEVEAESQNWYFRVPKAGADWHAEVGYEGRSGEFYALVNSNHVKTPVGKAASLVHQEFRALSEEFDEDYRETRRSQLNYLQKLKKRDDEFLARTDGDESWVNDAVPGVSEDPSPASRSLSSGALHGKGDAAEGDFGDEFQFPGSAGGLYPGASGPISSFSSSSFQAEGQEVDRDDDFFFWVDCELILHGGTEPDANVTVQGQAIKLRPDGTFTMRFVLPDGKIDMPVTATRADGKEKREARPIVKRRTE